MEEVCVFPFVFSRQPILSTDVLFKKFDNLDEIVEFYLNEDLALRDCKIVCVRMNDSLNLFL